MARQPIHRSPPPPTQTRSTTSSSVLRRSPRLTPMNSSTSSVRRSPRLNTLSTSAASGSRTRPNLDDTHRTTVETTNAATDLPPKHQSKRKGSIVWDHFTRETPEATVATCNHCSKKIVCGNKVGTKTMLGHIHDYCKAHRVPRKGVALKSPRSEHKFSQEQSNRDFSVAVVKHNYPLSMTEHIYFKHFLKGINPYYRLPCRSTLRKEILKIFKEEKVKLGKILAELDSRVSLTTDMWTSEHTNTPYCCVTIHYIDSDWILHKKIIAFKEVPYPHTGVALFEVLRGVIDEWKIGDKLFSIVVDNAGPNDVMLTRLQDWYSDSLVLDGRMLHVRCSAHILNLVVQDGLKIIKNLLGTIRDVVRLLDKSPNASQKFDQAKKECKLDHLKGIPLDVSTRWNSTYLMLEAALPLKSAFAFWAGDMLYSHLNPTESEWEKAKVIFDCLKPFYHATLRLSGSNYSTSNLFFIDIYDIHVHMLKWERSEHSYVREMVRNMKENFLKYWEDCNCTMGLTAAMVFDPRYKMQTVEYYYSLIYKNEGECALYTKRVREFIDDLFVAYGGNIHCSSGSREVDVSSSSSGLPSSLYEFEKWCHASDSLASEKSDLEKYLSEEKFNGLISLDVLLWWKQNHERVGGIMGKIARDILAVPATTVASESAFSTGGKVLSESRCTMLSDLVEAVVVSRDWISFLTDDSEIADALGMETDVVEFEEI